jgi:hypothetical protein
MSDTTHTNHDNTINFMYFMSNFPYRFIHEVWSGTIADHLESKFINACNLYNKSNFGFLYWFYELDYDNQTTLLNWVNANYKSYSHLKL